MKKTQKKDMECYTSRLVFAGMCHVHVSVGSVSVNYAILFNCSTMTLNLVFSTSESLVWRLEGAFTNFSSDFPFSY